MSDLIKALEEEKRYVADRMNGIDTSLIERLKQYGFHSLAEYFSAKKDYLWHNWIPEIRRDSIDVVSDVAEEAIKAKDYGVYIPTVEGKYAFHGTEELDLDICNKLGVRPVNMRYRGGTIVGSAKDFSIEILMPSEIGFTSADFINKMHEIISKYVDGVTVDGNDILINGEKVMGSMSRQENGVFVWAAQISFEEYHDEIEKICRKKSIKRPSCVRGGLTRDRLEREVIAWLRS